MRGYLIDHGQEMSLRSLRPWELIVRNGFAFLDDGDSYFKEISINRLVIEAHTLRFSGYIAQCLAGGSQVKAAIGQYVDYEFEWI